MTPVQIPIYDYTSSRTARSDVCSSTSNVKCLAVLRGRPISNHRAHNGPGVRWWSDAIKKIVGK
jgi:hypothetical protein